MIQWLAGNPLIRKGAAAEIGGVLRQQAARIERGPEGTIPSGPLVAGALRVVTHSRSVLTPEASVHPVVPHKRLRHSGLLLPLASAEAWVAAWPHGRSASVLGSGLGNHFRITSVF